MAPTTERRRFSLRSALVVVQVALSLVSLVGAGLFLRSLNAAQKLDPGFEPRNLLTMGFDLGLQGYDLPRCRNFYRDLLEQAAALPGVASVALGQAGPLQGTFLRSVFLEGQSQEDGTLVSVNVISPGYFDAMGVPLVRGRKFTAADREGAPQVVVINETMAKKFWPGKQPLGRRFRFYGDDYWVEVVGVAKDYKYQNLGEDPQPYIYQPLEQRLLTNANLIVRTAADPSHLLVSVQRQIQSLDRELPLVGVATVQERLDNSLWAPRMGAVLLAVFGFLALVLASVGIYGVMSYSVSQRSRELGIRMALGAHRRDVLRLILKQGLIMVAIGLGVGLTIALALSRLVASMLFGISPTDPLAFAVTALGLILVGAAASFFPARRATSLDPVVVLRYQ